MMGFFVRLRCASPKALALSALMALAAAVALERAGPRGGEFFVAMLVGLGAGMAAMALVAYRLRQGV